jgi:hypothetical protein
MSTEKDEIKEYADGWITERKGTDVPMFLKVAFVVIAAGCAAYFVIYMNGEVSNPDRGALVRAFNAATEHSNAFMYGVAGLIAVYAVVLFAFVFRKFHD